MHTGDNHYFQHVIYCDTTAIVIESKSFRFKKCISFIMRIKVILFSRSELPFFDFKFPLIIQFRTFFTIKRCSRCQRRISLLRPFTCATIHFAHSPRRNFLVFNFSIFSRTSFEENSHSVLILKLFDFLLKCWRKDCWRKKLMMIRQIILPLSRTARKLQEEADMLRPTNTTL